MPDPQLDDEPKKPKKPDATDVNLFNAGLRGLGIGILIILFGQWATFGRGMFWPFGLALTLMGAVFPLVYMWIMLRLARETEQPAPPNRIPN